MELLTREIILCIVVILISSSGICTAVDCGGPEFSSTIVVDKSNTSPNFTSIQAAIDSIPTSNSKWVKIQINAGIYKEKVNIPVDKPCIFIKGQGADVTTITYDDYSEITTSSTFSSFSNNLVASDITFQNSYGLKILENLRRHRKSYGIRTPSLAARISGDKCAFYKCAVDFIFGDGQSYYKDLSFLL
ncbi:probable pectinesterase 29 isoform X3 [Vigna unguiculata]|uniref:probable pectinesterase 29 isoform X3 n=1 Tax=Vigna unguiculata TaxID=3917 RepID=UPI001015FE69|nr:probable pectinesterase 29 isoform X3 [Vigna unguiculata]